MNSVRAFSVFSRLSLEEPTDRVFSAGSDVFGLTGGSFEPSQVPQPLLWYFGTRRGDPNLSNSYRFIPVHCLMKAVEAVKVKFYCFLGIVHPTVYNTVGEPD